MRRMTFYNVVFVIFSSFMLFSCEGDSDDSAETIAKALADRLTKSLQFDNGSLQDGGPPPYHEGTDWPQIEYVDPPDVTVDFGEDFTLDVKAKFDSPKDITGAMVWVKDSDFHIDIKENVDETNLLMSLKAKIINEDSLKGNQFDLYVSLYKGSETGLHETWRITIP